MWRTFWISASLNFPQTFLLMDMSVRKDIAEPEDESQARLSDILALTGQSVGIPAATFES